MLRYLVAAAVLGTALLVLPGFENAPVPDEASHLAAGISCWHLGRFDLYPVNPPLVRVVAAAPVKLLDPNTDWSVWDRQNPKRAPESRPEWSVGIGFVRRNVERAQWLFALARWACLPFFLIGMYFTWRWAYELYGKWAGVTALALWTFSPNILAWSATICPDAAAAALGVAAGYYFWRWLQSPNWSNALTAGVVLGLAQLTKMTWGILFALWPIVWLLWHMTRQRDAKSHSPRRQAAQLTAALAIAVLVLNMGYGFEGSFTKLGEFNFVSQTLAANNSLIEDEQGGNRFAHTWLAHVPVPLPYNYVRGMDLQKYDFQRGLPSYLCGQWQEHGWWYYYLVCAALKIPLGTWCLAIVAFAASIHRLRCSPSGPSNVNDGEQPRSAASCTWRDEMVLLLPAVVLFVFVSSQTGFSRHFRYVLPALPFLFIWISKVAPVAIRRPRTMGVLLVGCLTWSTLTSLWIYPHSMSYFNELVGGPRNGHQYLLDSNLDWGQDAFYLNRWRAEHPEATPLNTLFANSYAADLVGTRDHEKRLADAPGTARLTPHADAWAGAGAPFPGWYACRIRKINDADGDYLYFLRMQPAAMAGYGFRIYHITLKEANRVRRELGRPLLPDDWRPGDTYAPPTEAARAFVTSIAEAAQAKANVEIPIHVALFRLDDDANEAATALKELLDEPDNVECDIISAEEIQSDGLEGRDVVVFPGGGGGTMARALAAEGCQAVRDFVNRGGGYVGICGGAFLATAGYDWSLGLVNAKTLTGTITVPGQGEKSMAARGAGVVEMELTSSGREVFGKRSGLLEVRFSSGPVLSPAEVVNLPSYAPLAIYRSETWLHDEQRGTMIGTPAIVAAPFGQGRVILFSPHPETSERLKDFLTTAVHAVAPAHPKNL